MFFIIICREALKNEPCKGLSWIVLDSSWSCLGIAFGCLGVVLGCLGAVLGLSWAVLGLSWACLGLSWTVLGLSWAILKPGGRFGTFKDDFGTILGFILGPKMLLYLGHFCGHVWDQFLDQFWRRFGGHFGDHAQAEMESFLFTYFLKALGAALELFWEASWLSWGSLGGHGVPKTL